MEAGVSLSVDAEDGHGLSFDHIIGDAKSLHRDPANAGAVFQVASQFNALEMVGDLVHMLCCTDQSPFESIGRTWCLSTAWDHDIC